METSQALFRSIRTVALAAAFFVSGVGAASASGAASAEVPAVIVRDAGSYDFPGGDCPFSIKASPKGNFKQISFPAGKGHTNDVDDVTSAGFLNDHHLLFAISPLYGHAGIFLYNCSGKTIQQLVAPQHKNRAYPLGTDYFLLQRLANGIINFYYAPDVDQINFANFEEIDNLYEVHNNGAGFKKAAVK
jgi:hypothetical protein